MKRGIFLIVLLSLFFGGCTPYNGIVIIPSSRCSLLESRWWGTGGGDTPIQFVLIDSVGMILKIETDSVVLLFDDGMIQGKCEWEIPDYFFNPPPFYTITHRAVVEKKTDLVYLEGFFKAGNYSTAFNMDEIKKSMIFQWIVFETPLADYLFWVDTKEMSVMKLPEDLKKLNLTSGYTFKYGLLYPDELMLSGHIYTSPQLQ